MLDFQLRPFAQALRAFDQDLFSNQRHSTRSEMSWSLEEDEKAFYLLIDAPGVAKDEIDIEVIGQELIVKWSVKERARKVVAGNAKPRNFEHRFILSEQVDQGKIDANFLNGVLELKLDKKQANVSRKVLISDSSTLGDNLKN